VILAEEESGRFSDNGLSMESRSVNPSVRDFLIAEVLAFANAAR
jgi:predicted nucleotidyltransferase